MGRRPKRNPHPGVRIKRRKLRSGGSSWRAHFLDPETGRETAVTLEQTTAEARRDWAKAKAAELARKRAEASMPKPEPEPEPTSLEKAIADYEEDAKARLRDKTLTTYSLAIAHLKRWAAEEGIEAAEELTPAKLASLRTYLVKLPKRSAAAGAKRGAFRSTGKPRSPVSINRDLRGIKTLLGDWRTRGLLPQLHRDDISDTLKALPVERDEPPFLRPPTIAKLLAAALAHDAATYEETREEHRGERRKGSTLRYSPIAPFLACLLLSGMRRGEALAVEWSMVHLDATDHTGAVVGEIRLPARITKTKMGRTVGLEVSPALRKILAALKLRAGDEPRVFPYSENLVEAARRRLLRAEDEDGRSIGFSAPPFDWQTLRSTCATYLTNAPGIFGAATVFMSARQLGHSVTVAERHYLGTFRGIPHDARTLEAAMRIEKELAAVLKACSEANAKRARLTRAK